MPHHVPDEEKQVLENLLIIRAKLSAIKSNRTQYLTLDHVLPLRQETEAQARELIEIRGGSLFKEGQELNRTDDVLDEILQLLSLCFLSLGKKGEAPAVYVQVVAIKHIFDRLDEFGVYTEEYLKPYKLKLDEIEKILNLDEAILPEDVIQILRFKYIECRRIYDTLLDTIHEVAPELVPIRDRMLSIRHEIASVCCQSEYREKDMQHIKEEIREIDNMRVDGKFLAEDGSIPHGQAVLVNLLEQLFFWAHDRMVSYDDHIESIRQRLLEIKKQLVRLELTHKWTLRQTDLFTYQHQLHDIDKLRWTERDPELKGKFLNEQGEAPEGQTVLEFLLHKCYRMIFVLLSESIPVSEQLAPVYNQLITLRHCLLTVQKLGSTCSPEELYPYQMKLTSIDQLRTDGKFYDDRGQLPEGQALCTDILDECYQILDTLKEE
ncbi:hypothetical protein BDB01DRAFT_832574 [Pilobolus umbonatus]|nr:hypothetical protein BDB01DRAFT_832574 [Pilobolus umbonatus]